MEGTWANFWLKIRIVSAEPSLRSRESTEMGSVRSIQFSDDAKGSTEPDFASWPRVYVHPGDFLHAADRPRELEAWERYRVRFKRWEARFYDQKRDEVELHGRRWPVFLSIMVGRRDVCRKS